jgi:hypothetical protein
MDHLPNLDSLPEHRWLLERALARFRADDRVLGLVLSGSLSRGEDRAAARTSTPTSTFTSSCRTKRSIRSSPSGIPLPKLWTLRYFASS